MFIVGLTGGIATGKTTVSEMFHQLGCPIIDADLIAREVVQPGTVGLKKIQECFGPDILLENGELNREKLGEIIFANDDKRLKLNRIMHPLIQRTMMWKLLQHFIKGEQFVILDTPLLFESKKMLPYMGYTVVVSCTQEQQLSRLQSRNNLTEEQAKQRIKAQMSLEEKCRLATYVIDNSSDLENTKGQVLKLLNVFRLSRRHWKMRIALLSICVVIGSAISYMFMK